MKHPLIFAAMLPLAGCISFGAKPPASLLNLTATAPLSAKAERAVNAGDTIAVNIPVVPQAIATTRVVVSDGATAIAYVPKAAWVEAPARLFQRLLVETIGTRTNKIVIDTRQVSIEPASRLSGQLLQFGLDASTRDAVIVYDAVWSAGAGKPTLTRRFEKRVNVVAIDAVSVGPALNAAANGLAADVAAWIGGTG